MNKMMTYASVIALSTVLYDNSASADNLIPADLLRPAPTYDAPSSVSPSYEQPVIREVQPATPLSPADTVAPQGSDLPILSGGVGSDEVASMHAQKGNYNLHILSANKQGQHTGEIHIIIKDKSGKVVLDTEGGPLFYAKLPTGRYHVEGIREGISKKQTISVAGNKSAHIHFGW